MIQFKFMLCLIKNNFIRVAGRHFDRKQKGKKDNRRARACCFLEGVDVNFDVCCIEKF